MLITNILINNLTLWTDSKYRHKKTQVDNL